MISFKSSPQFYQKEITGIKNNTIRRISAGDEREDEISQYMAGLLPVLEIEIVLTTNPKEKFKRAVSDISYYEGYVIITWHHKIA